MTGGWVNLGTVVSVSQEQFDDAVEDERVYPVWGHRRPPADARDWAAVLRIVHSALKASS